MRTIDKHEAKTMGTHKVGSLHGYNYSDLILTFGSPTYLPEDSDDGKIQFEWVFEFNNNTYTLYDWKTYSKKYSKNNLTTWSVGGKTEASDFINELTKKLILKKS